jgi:RNA polymerase sigma factor (sigma-70 family)
VRLDKWSKHSALQRSEKSAEFERVMLPHLDAAHNLARWLTRDDSQAQDVVQEAYLRAFSGFETFRGGDARAWVLTIVRNTCYTLLKKRSPLHGAEVFDELAYAAPAPSSNPEVLHAKCADRESLERALRKLPVEYREVLILREFEDMSYREIAHAIDTPIGTVMSRLARARQRLQSILLDKKNEGAA